MHVVFGWSPVKLCTCGHRCLDRDTCPPRSWALMFRGRSCTQTENAATEPGLLHFLRPPRSHQTGLASTPGFCPSSCTVSSSGGARGKAGRHMGRSPDCGSLLRPQGPAGAAVSQPNGATAGSGSQDWAGGGVVRRSRGGRGLPGPGHPARACAPRACGAGWAPGGSSPNLASVYQQTAGAPQRRIPTR